MNNKNLIFYVIGIILLIGVGIMLAKNAGLFVITGDDIPLTNEYHINPGESFESFYNFSIVNQTITFNLNNNKKTITPGKNIFFMLDNSLIASDNFPDMTDGTHTIIKYQMFIENSGTQINLQKGQKTYDLIIKTVQKNVTVANQTFYVPGPTVYANQTITEYVNQTVEKQVQVEPTMEYIFQKYQMQILGVLAVGLVWYLTRKKKR